jgi:PAS domain S-box-containing protein
MLSLYSTKDLHDRVRWYIAMRWFFLLALAMAGILPQYLSSGFSEFVRDQISIVTTGLVLNVIFFAATRRRFPTAAFYLILAIAQIALDIILASWLILLNGGIESRTIIIYAIPIVMAGALLGRLAIYLTGIASAFSYVLFVSLDHYGILQPPNILNPFVHTDPTYFVRSVFFYSAALLSLSVIADYVGRLIRQRSQLEEEMRVMAAEKSKTDAILKTMGDALVTVDLDGRITLVNDKFEQLIGWKETEAVGQPIDQVLVILDENGKPVPAGQRPLLNALQEKQAGEVRIQRITDYYYRRKNGTTFPFTASVAPVVLQGRITGATTVFQNASAAQKVQRLRTNFVALASHQLKTPIAELKGYVENMLDGLIGDVNDKQQEYLRHMHEVTDRCNKLITDLLDITVLEHGGMLVNTKPTSLTAVIEDVKKVYSHRLERKGITIKVVEPNGTLQVLADRKKLVEVIGNMVANAIRYSKAGNDITITTKADNSFATVAVSDRGSGMDKAAVEALFQKDEILSAAPTAEGGTGLGLYLAKQLIILQKGSIALTATSDQGTTISIKIPLKGEDAHG